MKQRKILFKAKRIDNSEWVQGDLLQHVDGTTLIGDNQGEFTDDGCCHCDYHQVYEVNPSTVCQFTGLKDKNGNKIYENDIMVQVNTNILHTVGWNMSIPCYVAIADNEFQQEWHLGMVADLEFKVIGNKFDRKEGEK